MEKVLRPLSAMLVGGGGGAAFAFAHVPVPWLIGPLLTIAVCNMFGARLETPRWMRSTGQWLIGVALGLHFTPSMVATMAVYVPYMIFAAIMAVAFGTLGGWAVSRFGKVDRATAHFATAMGGAPEMAVAAERTGASIDQVVTAHMVRVLLTVLIVPAAVQYGAKLQPHIPVHGSSVFPSLSLVALALGSLGCAIVGKSFRFPNAFALVPLFITGGIMAAGVMTAEMLPHWISVAAQILIAVSLGSRFTPKSFATSQKLMIPIAGYSLVGICFAALMGVTLAYMTGLSVPVMVLSLAPGGMADMGIAADSLGLLVPVVTGFHVIRMALVVLLVSPVLRYIQTRAERGLSRNSQ